MASERTGILPHVHGVQDLVTSREAVRHGFLQQALTKTRKAMPYIQEAHALAETLLDTKNITELVHIRTVTIRNALIAVAGFSDKARSKMTTEELESALTQVLEEIQQRAKEEWRQEVVYRFLLTRGDTLGGSMRNVMGALGGAQLSKAIVGALAERGVTPLVTYAPKNIDKVVSLAWEDRLLVFDKKPMLIGNNIDVILLDTRQFAPNTVTLEEATSYLACGELKGGIDSAGADEHWKTALSAFDRIRERFNAHGLAIPALFFVGAAIENTMASQIFSMLQAGRLTYAANLTVPQQVDDLANWLVTL